MLSAFIFVAFKTFNNRFGRYMLAGGFGWAVLVGTAACDRASTLRFEDGEQPEATHSIAQLKTRCEGLRHPIVEGTVVRGTITANDRYGEFPRTLVIEDQTGGIAIAADYSAQDNPYPLGAEAIVYCNGLTLYDYGGKVRLGRSDGEGFCIPRGELGRHIRVSARAPRPLAATAVSIDRLTPALVDTYVRIDDVSFVESGTWCDRDPESGRYIATERTVEDPAGRTLAVRTPGSAHYADEPLPEGRGSLYGILDSFGGVYSLHIAAFKTAFAATAATPATAYP